MKPSLLLSFVILSAATIPLASCVVAPTGWDGGGYYESGGYYQPVVIEEPPDFIQPPEVGFYIAAGVPYDLYFSSNLFYLYSGSVWYTSSYYNGPWTKANHNHIPSAIRSYPREKIHYYRDNYSRRNKENGKWQEYKHFRPNRHEMPRGDRSSIPARNDSARQDQGNQRRPVTYNKTWPEQGYTMKPDFNSVNRQDRSNSERFVNTVPVKQVQGSLPKPAKYNPSRPGQGYVNNTSYNATSRQERGNSGKAVSGMPGKRDQANLTKPANNNSASTAQGYSKRNVHNAATKQQRDSTDRAGRNVPDKQDQGKSGGNVNNNPELTGPKKAGQLKSNFSATSLPQKARGPYR
jgi:hypothetical protein